MLGDTYLKSWMTEFFEDFFFSTVGGGIKKKHHHPHQGTEGAQKKSYDSLTETPPLLFLIVYESLNILSHYAGQSAAVALCMYQALEKPGCSVASLCSGPETGLARWVRIKKQ